MKRWLYKQFLLLLCQTYLELFKTEKDFFLPLVCNEHKIEYENIINTEFIDIDSRKKAIDDFYYFNNEFYDDFDNKSYISLGLLLFDRLISKNIIDICTTDGEDIDFVYRKLLFECIYICSRYLMYDIDILTVSEYLKIDIDYIHKDIIEILKLMDFDIYRPTVITYLNSKDDDFYHSKYIIDTAFSLFCCDHCINSNYDKCIKEINDIVEKEKILFDIRNFSDFDTFDNFEDLEVPKLQRYNS